MIHWRLRPRAAFGVSSAVLAFGLASQAFAQVAAPVATNQARAPSEPSASTSETVGEVVVTAQKRSENLQQVPIAITAVGSRELRAANVQGITDLSTVVSGLAIGIISEDFQPHLRGIGTSAFGPGVENPVALYIDGVYYPVQLGAPTDLSDISQVAVLKGPQGTLFGRNATGGVIQMTTKDPTRTFSGEFQTSLDNYLTSRNDLYWTGGVAPDLATSVDLKAATQGIGWGKNLFTGKDIRKIDYDYSVRNKWVYTPGLNTKVTAIFDYLDTSNSLGAQFAPPQGATPLAPGFVRSSNPWDVDNFITAYDKYSGGGISLAIDQDVHFAHLVSISAYRFYSYSTLLGPGLTPARSLDIYLKQGGNSFSQELQLVSENTTKLNWAVGLYYFHESEDLDPQTTSLFGVLSPTPFSVASISHHNTATTDSAAGFAQATYEILPRLKFTAGVRYTWEQRSLVGNDVVTLNIGNQFPASYSESAEFRRPTWRAALDYDLTKDVLAYVSYNRGFKSGGFNALNPSNPSYAPEVLDAYELGLKSTLWDRKLRLNLASFYYSYNNIQVSQYANQQANIVNGAAAELYGVDLDGRLKLARNLEITASAEWLQSRFTSYPMADYARLSPTIPNFLVGYFASATGNDLPYSPHLTADLGVNYTVDLPSDQTLLFNVTNAYNSGYFTEVDNNLRQKAYDYINTSVTWVSSGAKFSVKLWANNLLNDAVESELVTGVPEGYAQDIANPPRTFGATLNYNF